MLVFRMEATVFPLQDLSALEISQESFPMSKLELYNITITRNDIGSDGNQSFLFYALSKITTFTNKYFMGFVIINGILGNILSIIVFARCKKRDVVTVTYLTPLAYADLIILLYGAYSWILMGVLWVFLH
jgi:hypothetical protein